MALATRKSYAETQAALAEADTSIQLSAYERAVATLPWQGHFRAGRELYALIRLAKPEIVLETGVGAGFSSAHVLSSLHANGTGRLISIDLPNSDPGWKLVQDKRPGYLVPDELRGSWTLVMGDSVRELPRVLAGLDRVDLFLHDSAHVYDVMLFEFRSVFRLIPPGGLLVSDDAMWTTALLDFARETRTKINLLYHRGGSTPVPYLRRGMGA